jgi:ribosomal protein L37AE/L43A
VKLTHLQGGMTWEKLADGRVYRLKSGKHFPRGKVKAVEREAHIVAHEMDKAVRVLRDELGKQEYLWIQFAESQIREGEACPRCGGLEIARIHQHYGRCSSCSALLVVKRALESGDVLHRASRFDLKRYAELHVERYGRGRKYERYRGWAMTAEGQKVLLLVDYYLDEEGNRMTDPLRPEEPLYRLRSFPLMPFAAAVDLDALFEEIESDDELDDEPDDDPGEPAEDE